MKTKLIYVLAILVWNTFQVNGQQVNSPLNEKQINHAIGFGAGFTTGSGLSYKIMNNNLGAQINLGFLGDSENFFMSSGITFLYKVVETQKTNLYVYQGNHRIYNKYTDWDNNLIRESKWNNGIGAGIEIVILERIGINIMGGFAAYNNFNLVTLTGETALHYKF